VGSSDFSLFAIHYQHDTSSAGEPGGTTGGAPEARMRLVLEAGENEEHQPALVIKLFLSKMNHVSTFCASLGIIDPAVSGIQWAPKDDSPAYSMAAFPRRGGFREAFIAGFAMENVSCDEIELGTLQLTWGGDEDIDPEAAINFLFGEVMSADGTVARLSRVEVEDGQGRPSPAFRDFLYDSYPNPFNPATTIMYSTASDGPVELAVYDVSGELIRTLAKERKAKNIYTVLWDGKDNRGSNAASGVYFCRLKTPGYAAAKKVVLLR